MKNYTTPRTMAECSFTTGYQSKRLRRVDWGEVLRGLVTFAVFAGIGVMMAWRG